MNRNELYEYLKEKGLKNIIIRLDKKIYFFEFRLDQEKMQHDCEIELDWGYIYGVETIQLLAHGIKIGGRYSDMAIDIPYNKIEKFDLRVSEE